MANITRSSEEPSQDSLKETPVDKVDKKLDQIADDAAKQSGKTEQRYDKEHNIFTK